MSQALSVDTSGWIGSRRSFLRIGALGFAGLTLESLLRARRAQGASGRPEKSAILFWMAGGPSHIDTYDMKPDAPAEVRGPFRPIATNLPGLVVNEHMPRHAAIADKLAIVRSVSHDLSVHDDGSHWMQTGYPLLNAREKGQQHPCEGSVVSCVRGSNRPGVPAYVCVPEDYQTHMGFYQAAAYLGKRYDALSAYARIDRRTYGGPWFGLPEGLSAARIDDRRSLLAAFDALREHVETSDALRDADDVQQQAFELIGSREAREAFDLTKEPEFVHETYGRHAWGQYALLARRLVEAGVTFVTINLYDKDVDWWDDHYTIGKNLTKRLPPYDQAFSALVDDVHGRGLADRVLVAAYGEFGRAPRIDANAGRGHWPSAMSCVLSGGGLKTGQIVGSTTRDGAKPLDRPLSPGDLLATIYHALDIDPQRTLPDRLGRPIPLVPSGEPIRELV